MARVQRPGANSEVKVAGRVQIAESVWRCTGESELAGGKCRDSGNTRALVQAILLYHRVLANAAPH